jgi:hypothetical protein
MGLWESVPMTRAIRPLIREARLFYLQWQRRNINPMAPHLPEIVVEIARLETERTGNA